MGVNFIQQFKKPKSEYHKDEEVLITIRYYFQGKKLNLSSGVKCKIKDWNENWSKSNKREPILRSDEYWREKNLKLKDKESQINNIVLQIEKNGELPHVDIVKTYLRELKHTKEIKSIKKIHFMTLFEMFEKYVNSDTYPNRKSYVKTINTSIREIKSFSQEYQNKNKIILLPHDIDDQWMWELINWSFDKGLQPNTIRKRIKTLVRFGNWLRETHKIESHIKSPKEFKYIKEEKEVFFLTRDEVQKIKEFEEFNYTNPNHLKYLPKNTPVETWYIEDQIDRKNNGGVVTYTSYEVYKDMLLFLCGVGCRFGDMVKMKFNNFKFDDSTEKKYKGEFDEGRKGFFVFNMEKSKTNKQIRVPVNQLTFDIFKKYSNGKHPSQEFVKFHEFNEYLFPRTKMGNPISNQKFNKHIKEICKIIGINSLVRNFKVDLQNKIIDSTDMMVPKYQMCSSHIGRKTFIREHIERGTPVRTIMELSGHKSQKVFDGYYQVLDKDLLKNNNSMFSLNISESEPKRKPKSKPNLNISDEQVNQLTQLKQLFDNGLLDESEYKERKKLVLG